MKTDARDAVFVPKPDTERTVQDINPEDRKRREFLFQLDDAPGIEVSDWEAQFIGDHLDHPRPFTEPQRRAIDDMQKKYQDQL